MPSLLKHPEQEMFATRLCVLNLTFLSVPLHVCIFCLGGEDSTCFLLLVCLFFGELLCTAVLSHSVWL